MAKNKKKSGKSRKARSEKKILDAFTIAERANERDGGELSESDQDDLAVHDGVMDARKFMKNDADDDSFDDEELDSDDALGSEDDYDVLNSKFSQTIRDKKKAAKGRAPGSESEDEGYSSIDESQLVTLSQAWDLDEKDLRGGDKTRSSDIVLDDSRESEEEESEESEDSDESEESESESESEDEDEILRGEYDNDEVDMKSTLSTINAKAKTVPQYKRLVTETTEENEFSVPTGGAKLSLAEMMAAADPSDAPLIDREEDEAKPLPVPLPRRIQERNERKVAYEMTKEDAKKWEDSVRAIRNADHLLFPLPAPSTEEREEMTEEQEYEALRFVPETKPTSELELKVNSLLKAGALLDESKEATFEQIQAAKLSKDDMFMRTQELRRMRELMFRDEQRAKRIKKIKSKLFRKIRKKERLRDADLVEGSESEPEDHDMKRAEERMSLRHKTQSKWAQTMIKSGITKDASTRAELEEMLRNGERLRAKQLGYQEGEQSDDNVSDIERAYANDDETAEELERGKLGKGVLAMDFMKAAAERQRKENQKEMELLKEMATTQELEVTEKNSINVLKNQGRRVYAPSAAAQKEEMEEVEEDMLRDFRDDEAKSLENRLRANERPQEESDEPAAKKQKIEEQEFTGFDDSESDNDNEEDDDADAEENPWLSVGADETTKRSSKISAITQVSSRLSKAAGKIQKIAEKRKKGSKAPDTFIDLDSMLEMGGSVDSDGEDSGRMFRQQDLIKEAFAGDDVVNEFEAEKQQMAEDEGDKEMDMTLPGWGSWAGSDEPQKPRKKFVRKIQGVVQKDKRKDKNLKNVIINETVNKHNLKYQSSSVPYPYESKEQYERALRMPIGEEWSSRATHQKAIVPRVVVKQGMVVDPLKAPFK